MENNSVYNTSQNEGPSTNYINLQKILRCSAIFIGILLFLILGLDMGQNLESHDDNNDNNFRSLKEELNTIKSINDVLERMPVNIIEVPLNFSQNMSESVLHDLEVKKEKIQDFIDGFSGIAFRGQWTAKSPIFKNSNKTRGSISLEMSSLKRMDIKPRPNMVYFRVLDGDFLTNWLYARSEIKDFSNVTVTDSSINITYHTHMVYHGSDFEITNMTTSKFENIYYRLLYSILTDFYKNCFKVIK